MAHSRLDPRPTSKLTDQGKPSSTPSIPNSSLDAYRNTAEPKPTHHSLRHKHTFSALRPKPSLVHTLEVPLSRNSVLTCFRLSDSRNRSRFYVEKRLHCSVGASEMVVQCIASLPEARCRRPLLFSEVIH